VKHGLGWNVAAAFVLLLAGSATAAPPLIEPALAVGPHPVGFRLVEAHDASRAIRPDSTTAATFPRPLRVYVWYPAKADPQVTPLTFARYAELATADVWPDAVLKGARGVLSYARRPLARSVGPERFEELLERQVTAVEQAAAADGRFPLLVLGQGLYYESPVAHFALCESLASHGFVVATTPLVGTHSPLVQLDVIDLETQVRDLEFAVARARELPFVSQERLGVLGFDMGGMAALILAMRNPDVDALVTFDAAVLYGHPAGIPVDAQDYAPTLLRCPWLHATQRRFGTRPTDHDGPDLFAEAVHADRYLLLVDGVGHADFTSYSLIDGRDRMPGYWEQAQGGERGSYAVFCRYVRAFMAAHLTADIASREFLSRAPEEVAPDRGFTFEHRSPVAPRPTYSDFLNALLAGRVEAATGIAATLRTLDPEGPLLHEPTLDRLGFHFVFSWERFDEGLAVFGLNTELHPDSSHAWYSLGLGNVLKGDNAEALRCFQKVLELDPDHAPTLRMVEQLEAGE